MNIGLNSLNNPTINGLKSLNLDELSVNTIDGDLFYIDKIEAKEIIVDTKLSLTSTGIISVGSSTISDIELTYLDGVTSNIQQQITNNSNNNSGLTSTVNSHTSQITALQDKTQNQTANSTSTTFTKQINAPNGNIGYIINTLSPNNFYIQFNLASGNNIYLNSGAANIYLQSQNVYLGKADAVGRKSNLIMVSDNDSTYECQSSAFTEVLKLQILSNVTQILDLQSSDTN